MIDEPEAGLRVPDPEIDKRPYLALPLAEIGAEVEHPTSGESLAEIAVRLGEGLDIPRRVALELPSVSRVGG